MKVMSFNIWSDAPRNSSWRTRRERLAEIFRRQNPDLIGLQEATHPMIEDLHQRVPEYSWVGEGRDDGKQRGEFTPIFFRQDRFTLAEHGRFWLADACDQPGRGWDAMCFRVVTWARLEERQTGQHLLHFNTHLDHFGRQARTHSARLLIRKIAEIAGREPTILTGDFNCAENSAPYRLITGMLPFHQTPPGFTALRDTRYDATQPVEGPQKTYRGLLSLFGLGRIDHIFVKNGLRTERHAILEEGAGASDHRPVLAELHFTNDSR